MMISLMRLAFDGFAEVFSEGYCGDGEGNHAHGCGGLTTPPRDEELMLEETAR